MPVKRSYQKIQEDEEDEDDDYRSHTSPRNTAASATQLVGYQSLTWPVQKKCKILWNTYLFCFVPSSSMYNHFFLIHSCPSICIKQIVTRISWQTEELVKALQDLENAASGDAAVRQKIASLPQEVQDVSLLEKITGENLINGTSQICQCRTKNWKGTQYQYYHN